MSKYIVIIYCFIFFIGCQNFNYDKISPNQNKSKCDNNNNNNNKLLKTEIEPIKYKDDQITVRDELIYIITGLKNIKILEIKEDFIHIEKNASIFGFKGDIYFHIDEDDKKIYIIANSKNLFFKSNKNISVVEEIRTKYLNSKISPG